MPACDGNSERVLILAPHGRDAKVAAELLREGMLSTHICADIQELCDELERGASLALLAEESVATTDLRSLRRWLQKQAPWSDLPIVLLTLRGDAPGRNPDAQRLQEILGNVSFLERPFHPTTLVSVARAALRARRRQYQARALVDELAGSEERLRLFVEHAPAAMVMVDRDMRYLAVSQRWLHDFHLSDSIIGRSHYEVFPEISEAWRQENEGCLAGEVRKADTAERFARADGTVWWLKRDVRPWRDSQGKIGGLVISWDDTTATRDAAENEMLLARELQHRTKNLIAVIQSIAVGSFPADPHRDAFCARLHALAGAQNLLTDASWRGALMEDVVRRELASFSGRISIDGPRVFLKPSAVQGFTLVLHELATNAAKHGALTAPSGKIFVCWTVQGNSGEPSLVFRWKERGGPPAKPPEHRGFGSILLEKALSTPDHEPSFVYGPEGFSYEVDAEYAIGSATSE